MKGKDQVSFWDPLGATDVRLIAYGSVLHPTYNGFCYQLAPDPGHIYDMIWYDMVYFQTSNTRTQICIISWSCSTRNPWEIKNSRMISNVMLFKIWKGKPPDNLYSFPNNISFEENTSCKITSVSISTDRSAS